MKRIAILLAITALAISCSSSDSDQPVYSPRSRPPMDSPNRTVASGLDMLPPADWWHEPMLANAVKLSADQMTQLDKIAQDHGNEASRIETDMTIAVRDLRTQLDSAQATQDSVLTAAERVRALRDSLFDHQVQVLAAERATLTLDQWHTLQDQLQERRQQRNPNHGYPRRGGMGGRGRWPGY